MTIAESLFVYVTSIALLFLVLWVKKINWERLGLMPESLFKGWRQVLLFNVIVFVLISLVISDIFVEFPSWMTDRDPLIGLLVIVFIQEILFRGLLISWLERWGEQKALWISVIIFILFHLAAPYTWSSAGLIFAGLTFIGGYFWGWHFLKYRNIYLLTISHLFVNLSLNYLIFQFLLK